MSTPFTCYDVFLAVAGRQKPISREALIKAMWIEDTDLATLDSVLGDLLKQHLLDGDASGYVKGSHSKASDLLELLLVAVGYEFNYNLYLSEDMQNFLQSVYKLESFSDSELDSLPQKREFLHNMIKDRLILFISYEPLVMRLPHVLFFDLICSYFGIKPRTKFFDRKLNLDRIISDKLSTIEAKEMLPFSMGSRYIFASGSSTIERSIPKMQRLITYDIVPEQGEVFDQVTKENFAKAKQLVERNSVLLKRSLSIEIIHQYHSVALALNAKEDGYRTFEVEIRSNPYFKTAQAKRIPELIDKLLADYRKAISTSAGLLSIIAAASYFYNEFIHIHPFEDGNSRTAFLAMLHIFNLFGVDFDVPECFDYSFIKVTKGQRKRNDNELQELLKEIYISTLNKKELELMTNLAKKL